MDKLEPADMREFFLLKSRIFRDTKLDCHQFKDSYLRRRITVRMRARDAPSFRDYSKLLSSDPSEYEFLMKDLTINVTHFFRDRPVFKFFEEEVLPLLIYEKVKADRRVIRFWSAGCSSGEEAYSLAIMIKEMLGEQFDNFIVSIIGTDVDEKIVKQAKKGSYMPGQLENVNPKYLKEYFDFDGEKYHISGEIKKIVKFRKQDLFSKEKGKNFDFIFCRNVVIYFTRKMQDRLFMEFYNSLNDGGYLVIGKTETLLGESQARFESVSARERIYKKEKKREEV